MDESNKDETIIKFFWKNKRVSEKIYFLRLKQRESGKSLSKLRTQAYSNLKKQEEEENDRSNNYLEVDGRRIMHIKELGKNMKCCSCKSILSFENITSEKKIGVISIFYMKYRILDCNIITAVTTDKKHCFREKVVEVGKYINRVGQI